ncbi:MAG: hypothetical protein IVW53_15370 [Chloroflexi bacterium]|nr:hypothetical protein [Chloroflexota bacterium]
MSADNNTSTGRICMYARQQCTLADGCVSVERLQMGDDLTAIELRALGCEMRGAMLYAPEIQGAPLKTGEGITEKRAQLREARVNHLYRQIEERRDRQNPVFPKTAAGAALQEGDDE